MQQLQFKTLKTVRQSEPAPSNVVIDELEEETLKTLVQLMARAMNAVVCGTKEENDEG